MKQIHFNLKAEEPDTSLTPVQAIIYNDIIDEIRKAKRDNPIKARKLQQLRAEIYTDADIRRIVAHARIKDHLPIGSNSKGYFWITDKAGFEETELHFYSRTLKMLYALQVLKETVESKEEEQLSLF